MSVALKVMCFHGVGWVALVSIYVVLVSFGRLKSRMPSLLLAEYDIRYGG